MRMPLRPAGAGWAGMPVTETAAQSGASPRLRAVPAAVSATASCGAGASAFPFTATRTGRPSRPSAAAAATAQACSWVLASAGASSGPGSRPISSGRRSASTPLSFSSSATARASRAALP